MDINYELYKVFYHVASTLSFSEASKQLFISQSAVSQSIKTLERKLDQVLFIRSTKKVQLTPEGEILLRHIEPDKTMNFYDWEDKLEYMPDIDFLKTDAAEAEILTGYSDRIEAAKALYAMGAKEIMISHNTEILIYDGKEIFTSPIKARNLSGRTGRGDTCFFCL